MTTHGFCGASRRIEHATAREEERAACGAPEHQGPSPPSSSSSPVVAALFLAGSSRAGEHEALVRRQGTLHTCGRPRQHLESWGAARGMWGNAVRPFSALAEMRRARGQAPSQRNHFYPQFFSSSEVPPWRHDLQRSDLDWKSCTSKQLFAQAVWHLCGPQHGLVSFQSSRAAHPPGGMGDVPRLHPLPAAGLCVGRQLPRLQVSQGFFVWQLPGWMPSLASSERKQWGTCFC